MRRQIEIPNIKITRKTLRKSGMNDEEISEELNKKRKEFGHLIDEDDTLMYLICKEKAVSIDPTIVDEGESTKEEDTYSIVESLEDVIEGEEVQVKGVVDVINSSSYIGCEKCKRKTCDCDVEVTELTIDDIYILTDGGKVKAIASANHEISIEKMDAVKIKGRVMKDEKRGKYISIDIVDEF